MDASDHHPSEIFPAPQKPDKSSSPGLLISIFIILLLIFGVGAYFLSRRLSGSSSQVLSQETSSADNSISPLPTTEFREIINTDTPSPSSKPTPSVKPTSTPKPTVVPTSTLTPTPNIVSLTLTSTNQLDGFESGNGGGNSTIEVRAGRNANLTTRGFVSFSVDDATFSGKIIDSVKLRLYQYKVDGNPYGIGGTLLVDHMDYGSTLENSDYNLAVFDSNSGTFGGASNPTYEWKDADVTSAFRADLSAGHSRTQYRIRFTTEAVGGDVTGDFAYFYSSNSGSNTQPPQLVIRYH